MAARYAVVWFNQVHSWNGLRSAVMWAAVERLSRDKNDAYQVAGLLPGLKVNANQPSALTRPAKAEDEGTPESPWVFEDQNDATVTPDRWFTSLWTLQEVCLRPDMILCDRDWSVFGVGEAEFHVPISLDHLVALF